MDANKLRSVLADQITMLHGKKGDPKVANAIANTSGKLISTIRLELEYCKQYGLTPCISFIKTNGAAQKLPVEQKKPTRALKAGK